MRSLDIVARQEFIGREIEIATPAAESPIRGKVIDETKNMIRIESGGREISFAKREASISVEGLDGEIPGYLLVGNPEDRIKKRMRRKLT